MSTPVRHPDAPPKSLRDEIAMAVLPAIIPAPIGLKLSPSDIKAVAEMTYQIADAVMTERER